MYGGKVLAAMYHGSCGGRTKSAEEVGLSGETYPYTPVECEACRREAPAWKRSLDARNAASLLNGPSESRRLYLNRTFGSDTLPGNNYTAHADGANVSVEGRGEGHGIGVCQRGIVALARLGVEFRALLSRYLPQTRTGGRPF